MLKVNKTNSRVTVQKRNGFIIASTEGHRPVNLSWLLTAINNNADLQKLFNTNDAVYKAILELKEDNILYLD